MENTFSFLFIQRCVSHIVHIIVYRNSEWHNERMRLHSLFCSFNHCRLENAKTTTLIRYGTVIRRGFRLILEGKLQIKWICIKQLVVLCVNEGNFVLLLMKQLFEMLREMNDKGVKAFMRLHGFELNEEQFVYFFSATSSVNHLIYWQFFFYLFQNDTQFDPNEFPNDISKHTKGAETSIVIFHTHSSNIRKRMGNAFHPITFQS